MTKTSFPLDITLSARKDKNSPVVSLFLKDTNLSGIFKALCKVIVVYLHVTYGYFNSQPVKPKQGHGAFSLAVFWGFWLVIKAEELNQAIDRALSMAGQAMHETFVLYMVSLVVGLVTIRLKGVMAA